MIQLNHVCRVLVMGMVIIFASLVHSQNCIDGTITDSKTGAQLSGVSVIAIGTSLQATSTTSGTFSICQQGVTGMTTGQLFLPGNRERPLVFPVSLFDLRGTQLGIVVNEDGLSNLFSQIKNGVYLMGNPNGEYHINKVLVAGDFHNVSPLTLSNLSPTRAKAAAAGDIILEAESMTLNGYIVDLKYDGVRDMIMVDPNSPVPSSGTAITIFSGATGTYNIDLYTAPENDGDLIVKLFVGGKEILNEVYPFKSGYMRTEEKIFTIKGVAITNGDEIKIEGTSNALAYARVDKIIFADPSGATLQFNKQGYVQKEVDVIFGQTTNLNVVLAPVPAIGEKPGPLNTGYKGTLTPFSGPITKGAVIENVIFSSGITINVDNVTIRNFKIDGGGSWYGINIKSGSNHLFEDGEIINATSALILGGNYTARRLNLHDSQSDALKPNGNVVVEGCYIHRLGKVAGAHADGVQARSGRNFVFKGNNFDMPKSEFPDYPGEPYKANVTLYIDQGGPSATDDILIEGNWLNGGNYTVHNSSNNAATNIRVINNKFGRSYRYGIKRGSFAAWTGNVWEDTGLPAP